MTTLYPVYVPKLLSRDEHFVSGRRSCKGCGKALSLRMISKMVGRDVVASSPGSDPSPFSRYGKTGAGVPWDEITSGDLAFSFVNRLMAENERSREKKGAGRRIKKAVLGIDMRIFSKDPLVVHEVVNADREVLYLCYDSEMYMDALIRKYAPSLNGHEAVRLPGKKEMASFIRNKNIPPSVWDSSLSYVATACPSFPLDLWGKIRKGLRTRGAAFISLLTPCPTAWLFKPEMTAHLGVLAVETGFYPLLERESGSVSLTIEVPKLQPLSNYFRAQQRYVTFLPELVALMQEVVSEEYAGLVKRAQGKDV